MPFSPPTIFPLFASLLLASILPADSFQQREFVISNWVDPIVPAADFSSAYAAMAAANFTLIMGGFGAPTAELIAQQLKAAEENGLKVAIAGAGGKTNVSWLPAASASPALLGYQLADEPSVSAFPPLAQWMDAIAAARPGMLRFVNLLPNYATSFGAPTYGEYLTTFVSQTRPDVLSMDHYPRFDVPYAVPGNNKTRAGYCDNLAALRTVALAAGLPFWNFFASMPYDDYPDPSEAQLRWQVLTSLAYGAKGVLYFCYWSPVGSDFPRGGALVTPRGPGAGVFQLGPHYTQAARINSVLRQFGFVLVNATSTGVFRVTGDEVAPASVLVGCVVANVSGHAVSSQLPGDGLLLGQFALPDERIALLLANHNIPHNLWLNVWLAGGVAVDAVREVKAGVAGEQPLLDDSPGMPGLQLSVQASDARLFIFPSSKDNAAY